MELLSIKKVKLGLELHLNGNQELILTTLSSIIKSDEEIQDAFIMSYHLRKYYDTVPDVLKYLPDLNFEFKIEVNKGAITVQKKGGFTILVVVLISIFENINDKLDGAIVKAIELAMGDNIDNIVREKQMKGNDKAPEILELFKKSFEDKNQAPVIKIDGDFEDEEDE